MVTVRASRATIVSRSTILQTSSTVTATASEVARLATARARFALPMKVIREVVVAATGAKPPPELDELFTSIADTFWRIDDLLDLQTDLQTGALNAIAVAAGAVPTAAPTLEAIKPIAKQLATSAAIDHACKELETHAANVTRLLSASHWPAEPAARLRSVFASFTRRPFGA